MTPLAALLALVTLAPARALAGRPFGPGERFSLEVSYLGVGVGRADVEVGRAVPSNDGSLLPIHVFAATRGLADRLYAIRDVFTTWWDPARARPCGSHLDAHEGGRAHSLDVRFTTSGEAIVVREKPGARDESRRGVDPDTQDLASVAFFIRSRPLRAGDAFTAPVFTGKDEWSMEVRVAGREMVEVPAGRFAAIVVKARTHLGGKWSSRRDLTLWVTDDERHVPVRIDADFAVGALSARLVDYQAPEPLASR